MVSLVRDLIGRSFKTLVQQKKYGRITVKDISNASGISRNTFYYHFSDINDLTIWIFRRDLAELLIKRFSAETLVRKSDIDGDKYNEYPFYLDMRSKEKNLELGEFWYVLTSFFHKNRNYYSPIFNYSDFNFVSRIPLVSGFTKYLFKLYNKQFQYDVDFALDGLDVSHKDKVLLASYFTNACLGWIINSVNRFLPDVIPTEITPFENADLFPNFSHTIIKNVALGSMPLNSKMKAQAQALADTYAVGITDKERPLIVLGSKEGI
jgi:AcrR family transcriptional regulator